MIAAAMSPGAWALAVLTLVSVDAIAIAYIIDRRQPREEEPRYWFDHDRFVKERARALLDRALAGGEQRGVIEHPCSYGGDIIEFPVAGTWDEDTILQTLDEIGAL